jgi:hypothetical protein
MAAKKPTKAQRIRWEKIREMGCIICGNHAAIHHCFTGGGGRKDHDKVIALCETHHTGNQGIHTLSRKAWTKIYNGEEYYMQKTKELLGE